MLVVCLKVFATMNSAKQHFKDFHMKKEPKIITESVKKPAKGIENLDLAKKNLKIDCTIEEIDLFLEKLDDGRVRCSRCLAILAHRQNGRRHFKRSHGRNPPIFQCHMCEKNYSERHSLNRHYKTHEKLKIVKRTEKFGTTKINQIMQVRKN